MSTVDISNSNSYLGLYAGSSDSDFALQNTYLGYYSGTNVINSMNSTFIGATTSQTTGQTFTKSTAIGHGANVTASNQIVLGASSEYVLVPGTAASTSATTGALQVAGGLSVSGDIYCKNIYANVNNVNLTSVSVNAPQNIVLTNGTTGSNQLSTDYNADFTYNPATSVFKFANTTLDGSNNTCTASAAKVQITSDNTNTTCYVPFTKSTSTASPNQSLYVDDTTGPLTYNPSTSTLSCSTASLSAVSMTGSNPNVNFGSGGPSLSYPSFVQNFSTSAAISDCVLRGDATNKLMLQTGESINPAPIIINGTNAVLMQPGYTTPPTLTSSQLGYFAKVTISDAVQIGSNYPYVFTIGSITLPTAGYYILSYNFCWQNPVTSTNTVMYSGLCTTTGSVTYINGTGRVVNVFASATITNNYDSSAASAPYLCSAANTSIYLNAQCNAITPSTNYATNNANTNISYLRIM